MSDPARSAYAFGWDRKLRKTDEFSSVFRFRRVLRGNALDVHARPNGLEMARLGLIVPKKILPRAVDRNLVKRVLREIFRLSQDQLRGMDLIVRIKGRALIVDYRREGEQLMRASNVCHKRTAVEKNG